MKSCPNANACLSRTCSMVGRLVTRARCTIGVELQILSTRNEDCTTRQNVTGARRRTLSHHDLLPGPSQHEGTPTPEAGQTTLPYRSGAGAFLFRWFEAKLR